MGRWALAKRGQEAGGSAVSFVMVLPLLATLVCAIVDLGRIAYVGAELENATQAACRWASEQVSYTGSVQLREEDALKVALSASPSLDSPDFRCSVKPQCSAVPETAYQRHSFNKASGLFDVQDDSLKSVEVSVASTLEGTSLTPVGRVAFSSDGNAGRFALSSRAVRTVYVSQEAGDE